MAQPKTNNLYGFIADMLEQRSQIKMEDEKFTEKPEKSRLTAQGSLERKVSAITAESVKSATLDPKSPVKRKLRREGTFNIYDSGKNTWFLQSTFWWKKQKNILTQIIFREINLENGSIRWEMIFQFPPQHCSTLPIFVNFIIRKEAIAVRHTVTYLCFSS